VRGINQMVLFMSSFELIRRSIIRYYRFIPGDNALIQRYLQILELGGLVFAHSTFIGRDMLKDDAFHDALAQQKRRVSDGS